METGKDGVLKCGGLAGAALFLCQLETGTLEKDPVEEMWSCVEDEFVKGGGTKEALYKLANKGFVAEPHGYQRFVDDPKVLERQEKLNFAYDDPKYYHCINKAGLPIQFAMNDYNEKTTFDEKTSKRFKKEVDAIKQGLAKEVEKYPEGSREYRREFAKRIYDQTVKNEKFYGDCEIECNDYDSVNFKQGACTETSTVMYFKLKYAGLNPEYSYWHDIQPSLRWIELLPNLGEAADHIFIGVPLSEKNDATSSQNYIYIDLVNQLFDVEYKHAKKISERTFASMSSLNKFSDLVGQQRFKEAEDALKVAAMLTPEDIHPFVQFGNLYIAQGRKDDLAFVTGYIEKVFKEHPWCGPVLLRNKNSALDPSTIDEEKAKKLIGQLDDELEKMAKKDPFMAAQINYFMAKPAMYEFLKNVKAASERGGNIDPAFSKQLEYLGNNIVEAYFKSLILDPNFIFAFRDLEMMLNLVSAHPVGIKVYEKLLEKHPKHTPFIYAYGRHLANASKATGIDPELSARLLLAAEKAFDRLSELENESPLPHIEKCKILVAQGDIKQALVSLNRADALFQKSGGGIPLESYMMRTACNIIIGDGKQAMSAAKEAVKKYPDKAPAYLAEELYLHLNWHFSLEQKNYIKDDSMPPLESDDMRNYAKCTDDVSKYLQKFEAARGGVEILRAYFMPFMLFFWGPDVVEEWLDDFPSKPSPRAVGQLAQSTNGMAMLIQSLNAHIDKKRYEDIEKYVEMVEPVLKEKFSNVIDQTRGGLLWGYVLLQDRDRAEDIIDELPKKFIVDALAFCVIKLVNFGRGTKVNTERLYFAMDLMWDNRKLLDDANRAKLVEMNHRLAALCRQHGMDEKAKTAEERAEELRK